jgi:tagatose-1,6-bisphosphate aldolase non-catalytic subunit AgaZ/GatZ
MDHHIEETIYKTDYQPKTGFIEFCKDNEAILKVSITKIFEQGIQDSNLIEDKIKKTYKNRYFMLTTKQNN